MVVLQRRHVLIAQSQISLRVYLIPTDRDRQRYKPVGDMARNAASFAA